MKRIPWLIAVLLGLAPAFAADDTPRYSMLVEMPKKLAALHTDLDQLALSARLTSTDPGVKPSDITVEATLKSGQVVRIPIAADGAFTAPTSPELEQENPPLVTNQPKGTMVFTVQIDVKAPAVTTQRYAELMRGLSQLEMAKKRVGIFQGPKPHGLLFAFEEGGHALTVQTKKKGNKVFSSESLEQSRKHVKEVKLPDDGNSTYIYVPLDEDFLTENPQTIFDALPVRVLLAI